MLLAVIVAFTVFVDLFTKYTVKTNMEIGDTIPLIKDCLHITYVENKGAAFSMLENARWVFLVVSTVAIVAIIWYLAAYGKKLSLLSKISLSMILGGAIGNMVDRVFNGSVLFDGAVVDFIDFRLINFAVFNAADSFVCVGAGLLILSLLLEEVRGAKEAKKEKSEAKSGSSGENAE